MTNDEIARQIIKVDDMLNAARKDEAVQFAEWICYNRYTEDKDLDGRNAHWFDITGECISLSTAELYKLFLKSK